MAIDGANGTGSGRRPSTLELLALAEQEVADRPRGRSPGGTYSTGRTELESEAQQPSQPLDAVQLRTDLVKAGIPARDLQGLEGVHLDTLSDMMIESPDIVRQLLGHAPIRQIDGSVGGILEDVAAFISYGNRYWTNFFARRRLFSDKPNRVRTSMASLHCAVPHAAHTRRCDFFGRSMKTGFKDFPLYSELRDRFAPLLVGGKNTFNRMTMNLSITASIPSGIVMYTVSMLDRDAVAFDFHGRPHQEGAQATLLGYKLLSYAVKPSVSAPVADVVIAGGAGVNRVWFAEMQQAAQKLRVDFRVRAFTARNAPLRPMALR